MQQHRQWTGPADPAFHLAAGRFAISENTEQGVNTRIVGRCLVPELKKSTSQI